MSKFIVNFQKFLEEGQSPSPNSTPTGATLSSDVIYRRLLRHRRDTATTAGLCALWSRTLDLYLDINGVTIREIRRILYEVCNIVLYNGCRNPCLFCLKSSKNNQKDIFCDSCSKWIHLNGTTFSVPVTVTVFRQIIVTGSVFKKNVSDIFPFKGIDMILIFIVVCITIRIVIKFMQN